MKIYFNIDTRAKFDELLNFCSEDGIYISDSYTNLGLWCLDNTSNTAYYPTEKEVEGIPNSFRLVWDKQRISDLFFNKVIGRFNEGKLQWTLMNSKAMEPMIQVLMYGTKKYDRDNWQKACPKRLDLMDSLQRHSMKIIAGESVDPESNLPHIGHLMCNAMFYSYWEQKTNGLFENYVPETN